MLSVLRNTTYARLFTAQVIALIGTGLLTVALGLLAYDIAGGDAGVVLGTALTIKMVAYVGVSPVATALVAQLPRRRVLVTADLLRAVVALALPFVTETWQIYILILVLQSASATFTPTFQALIPAVLPDEEEYTRALSLSRLAYDLEALVSPMLAAALLTVVSYHSLFVGTVFGFLGSAALVLASRLPHLPPPPPARFVDNLTRGVRIFLRQRELRSLAAMNLTVAAVSAVVIVNTVVVVRDVLGRSQQDVAVMLACYGAGSMVVALRLPAVLDRVSDLQVMLTGATVMPATLLTGAGVLAVTGDAGATTWIPLLILWALLGAATSLVLTPSARLLRRNSDEVSRPSVFAAQFSLSHACFLVTYPLAGFLGAALGQGAAAAVLAVLAGVGTVAAIATAPRRKVDRTSTRHT